MVLAFLSMLLGVVYPWFDPQPTVELSVLKMEIMLGFSTLTFLFMLTLYRLLQRLFRRGIKIDGDKIDFDERNLVRVVGLFGFIPFGLTLQIGTFGSSAPDPNFGKIMVIQGLAITLAAWLSRLIKK